MVTHYKASSKLRRHFLFVDIDECESNPCANGGSCTEIQHVYGGYSCECARGFTGSGC